MLKSWFPRQETGLIKLCSKKRLELFALACGEFKVPCLQSRFGLLMSLTLCTSWFSNRP